MLENRINPFSKFHRQSRMQEQTVLRARGYAGVWREGARKKEGREESAQRCVRPFFAAQKRYSRSFRSFYGGAATTRNGEEEEIEMQTTIL